MRVGILTLHSQTNYGGVLQAYALQQFVRGLGHDVVVLNRRMEKGAALNGILSSLSFVAWIKFILRGALGFGDFRDLLRKLKTQRFIKCFLRLGSCAFNEWGDIHGDPNCDVVIVGSDQVWHPSLCNPTAVYLLEGARRDVKAISYAASFGVLRLDESLLPLYRERLARFGLISVREKSGAGILADLGFDSAKVLDPVLLLGGSGWRRMLKDGVVDHGGLVCYFTEPAHLMSLEMLEGFAKRHRIRATVFFGRCCAEFSGSFLDILKTMATSFRRLASPVRFRFSDGPAQFLQHIGSARFVVTDSFHGLAFSALLGKHIRIIRPISQTRAAMFSRIEEFLSEFVIGDVCSNDLKGALLALEHTDGTQYNQVEIDKAREESACWLQTALESVVSKKDDMCCF